MLIAFDIATLASVCAHEFGHILQFKRQLPRRVLAGQSTVKRLELQADLFAGYFAGVRKRERPDYPAAVFAVTKHLGGDFTNPNHHGTPDERAGAVVRGFEAAFRERLDFEAMIDMSLHYVARL
jgi:predicted metalloprotease